MGQAAATSGAKSTARRLRWLKKTQVIRRDRTSKRLLLQDKSIPALREVSAELGYVAKTSRTVGQGSISALADTLASAAQKDMASVEQQLAWLRHE